MSKRVLRGAIRAAAERLAHHEALLRAFRQVRLRGRVTVLMYHEVAEDDAGVDAWTVVRRSDFERQVDYLREHFTVLSLGEALRRMRGGVDEPSCVITFDDGYAGNRDVVLPIVRSRELPITVFVATEAVAVQRPYWYDRLFIAWHGCGPHLLSLQSHGLGEFAINHERGAARWNEKERLLRALKRLDPRRRDAVVDEILARSPGVPSGTTAPIAPLSVVQVQELAAEGCVEIGAHSHCHSLLPQLPAESRRRSVQLSKDLLEEWVGRPIAHFSYPNGDHTPEVVREVRELGFASAVTTCSRPWARSDSPYTVPRIGIGRYDSFEAFKAKVSGAFKYADG